VSVTAIVGLQYGSEGKGHLAHLLASVTDAAIRTGGPNAGHTLTHRGTTYKMRQIPCAFVNPAALLLIGPGGLIAPDVLATEVATLRATGHQLAGRLFIHAAAGIIDSRHRDTEAAAGLTDRIGSTGEGVGAATADRALRILDTAGHRSELLPAEATVISAGEYLDLVHDMHDRRGRIMLEGTQGAHLSVYHGPYPAVTSRDTTAASLAGAAGIAPTMVTDVVGVARAFPIRVAGNSGPLPHETDFASLGVPPEHTTVTGRVRRIARFDPVAFRQAIQLNRPTTLALTFGDYLPEPAREPFRELVECLSGRPVDYYGLGPTLTDAWLRPDTVLHTAHDTWTRHGGT
jgi:adenylosuccinate synthase